jgi:hypothetical protein
VCGYSAVGSPYHPPKTFATAAAAYKQQRNSSKQNNMDTTEQEDIETDLARIETAF